MAWFGGLSRWTALVTVLAVVSALFAADMPAHAQSRPPADVVFLIDESGSMSPYQQAVRNNVDFIASELGLYVDPRFALVGFGEGGSHQQPSGTPHKHTDFTDLSGFQEALAELRASGGFEPGVLATIYAMEELTGFRPQANTCVVLVTDEGSGGGDLQTAKEALDRRNAVWFGIVNPNHGNTTSVYGPEAGSLSDHTGGGVSSIADFANDPQPVLEALLARCASAAALPPGAENLGYPRGAELIIDPVNPATGNFVESYTDIDFPDAVFGMDVTRVYNALDGSAGPLGPGWTAPYATTLTVLPDGDVVLLEPDGRRLRFEPTDSGGFTRPPAFFGDLAQTDGGYEVRLDRGETWTYNSDGLLQSLSEWTGQAVTMTHDDDGRVTRAESTTGYATTFTYDEAGNLLGVASDDGRQVAYLRNNAGFLHKVELPEGAVETYKTDDTGRITEIRDPDGRLVVANEYDDLNRVVGQTTPDGDVDLEYVDGDTTVLTDHRTGESTSFTYDEAGHLRTVTDATGAVLQVSYDENGNLTDSVDRRSGAIQRTYDGGNLLTEIDALGRTTTYTYDNTSRLISVTDADGNSFAFAYEGDERLPSAVTAPDGAETTAAIDGGLVTALTDPDGITETFDYDRRRPAHGPRSRRTCQEQRC